MTKTRKYMIKAQIVVEDNNSIRFTYPQAVPVSRAVIGDWYIATDAGEPLIFEATTPHSIEFERAITRSWSFAKRSQIRINESGETEIRTLQIV